MVKPEFKGDKPKLLPSESSDDSNMDVNGKFLMSKDSEDGEVIVTFDETRGRKGPRICVFVGLFVFVLVVGFLSVYLIGRTHGNKTEHERRANMADDIAQIPTGAPELSNTSKLWQKNASWETREELFQLSDTIGSSDIIGLKPIYRKDLPSNYIAYWEVKLNSKTGEKYVIISAAKETGDHRLAQEGSLPSPLDLMSDSARLFGHSCHKVYRLTPDGLMVCEDKSLGRIVAATRDIETDSEFEELKWRKLDKQVQRSLPRFRKAWNDQAKRVQKLPEWRRFKWLSMKAGQKPTRQTYDNDDDDHFDDDFDDDDDNDDEVEELGIKPGQMFKIPLGPGSFMEGNYPCRIKFAGLRNSKMHGRKKKNWLSRWQRRLCRVLDNACEGSDLTRVKQRYFKQTMMGDRYIKLQIKSDSRYVRRQLQGQEIRFRIEIRTNRKKAVVVNYGIILKTSRHGRSIHDIEHNIAYPQWFPTYKQHRHGHCWTGSGAVAWGMVLGYLDNLAHRVPHLRYPKNLLGVSSKPVSLDTDKTSQLFIEKIHNILKSACSTHGASDTSPAKMKRIEKLLKNTNLRLEIRSDMSNPNDVTSRAIEVLEHGLPVIVSRERGTPHHHHYSVATRLRLRSRHYRTCRRNNCGRFRDDVTKEIYVRMGLGPRGDRWENADTYFMAAIIAKR